MGEPIKSKKFYIRYVKKCKVNYTKQKGAGVVENRIHELRRKRGITQSELADAVEVTRQTIISLESGKYNASLILAHKIAQYFGLAIEEIFIFDKEEENI